MRSLQTAKWLTLAIVLIIAVLPSAYAQESAPAGVVFETNIEYSNPDDQHLQLNLARPKDGVGLFPAMSCIHGGGFRAGKRESFSLLRSFGHAG